MSWESFGRWVAFGLSIVLVGFVLLVFEAVATDPVALSTYRLIIGAGMLVLIGDLICDLIWRKK